MSNSGPTSAPPLAEPPWAEFARSPLVPFALAATAGLIADRYLDIPFAASLSVAVLAVLGWGLGRGRPGSYATVWICIATAALGAGHHHRLDPSSDDVSRVVVGEPVPVVVRGRLDEEPTSPPPPKPDPLVSVQPVRTSRTVLEVAALQSADGWMPASGRVRLMVEGGLDGIHLGDEVEVVGRLSIPTPPGNPGEADYPRHLRDRRITAELRSKRSAAGVSRLEVGWRGTVMGWFAFVRGWGTRVLRESLPPDESGIAAALLLGDSSGMDRAGWDQYVRTGVIHVLAISGQHLVVLAGFVWVMLWAAGVRRRHGAWAVAGVMIAYLLLTGVRPSSVRAVVMVCVVCGGIVLRRRVIPANAFAFAWLVVSILDPADIFTAGCQLSFLAVFVLIWFVSPLLAPKPQTPVEQLLAESRTTVEKVLRWLMRMVLGLVVVSVVLAAVNAPLILAWQNIVSPVGVLIGPPLVFLSSIALLIGFLLLLAAPVPGVNLLVGPLAWCTYISLAGCDAIVRLADRIPGGCVYAPAPAMWWLCGFYAGVAGMTLCIGRWRLRFLIGLLIWVTFGLGHGGYQPTPDETRFTFLAVGHGGCVVIETPDARVFLYDVGTQTGPDIVRRVVAPFLWSRGIDRVDEVFLSHADLDHFNGIVELMKRFPVGRITHTPTFPEKDTPGVAAALAAVAASGVECRTTMVGDRFTAGGMTIDVLHPPPTGPPGVENVRSLVLLIRHAGHTVVLTGDLEKEGQDQVCDRPIPPADVLMAPHHGGKSANFGSSANPCRMSNWAHPRLVISSQNPSPSAHLGSAYPGATVWDTPTAGAVTVRSHASGLTARAFRTGELRVVRRGE